MKFQSQIIASGSGSIGGCTYSRNRFGQYIRRRAMPVNPGSAFAQVMTNFFGTLVQRWTSTLTQPQRDAWDVWAINTPQADALGNPINWTGQNAYISMNALRLQLGETYVDAAPSVFAGATFTAPSGIVILNVSEATQDFDFNFINTDPWAGSVGGSLGIYVSRPQNPSINFFKGPYRLGLVVPGAVIPPTSPATVPVPFPITEGQRIFVQARVCQADARISAIARYTELVGP